MTPCRLPNGQLCDSFACRRVGCQARPRDVVQHDVTEEDVLRAPGARAAVATPPAADEIDDIP